MEITKLQWLNSDQTAILATIDGRVWSVPVPETGTTPHRFWVLIEEARAGGMEVEAA